MSVPKLSEEFKKENPPPKPKTMNKEELTAEECFNSTELAKFKNKKSFTKETMFDFAEHYHEIKSKELREELEIRQKRYDQKIKSFATTLEYERSRIKELEEKLERAEYLNKINSKANPKN